MQVQLFPATSQLPSSPGVGFAFPHSLFAQPRKARPSPHPSDRDAAMPAQAAHLWEPTGLILHGASWCVGQGFALRDRICDLSIFDQHYTPHIGLVLER